VPTLGQRVDESSHQRELWSDHCEVNRLPLDGRDKALYVLNGYVKQACVVCDPGVSGRAQQLRALGRARERAYERVLASARSDDEYLHRDAMNSSTPIAESVS
jgi:hypothetical protein